jgi:hypothetical protein
VANDVKLTIRVSDNGSLDVVQKKAKAAADSLGGLGKAQRKAGDAADHYQKRQKGVGQAGLSSAKSFSKMTTGISGGLVPAYATLAANVFAVTAAFGALQRAQATAQLEEGLKIVGQAAGQNLPYVASQIKGITGAAVSMKQAMESTALAISAGFSTKQLKELTKVAKGASLALGRDMGDALTRLTKGTAKLEPEILDELGILVRLDEASQKYADSMGKPVDSLTRFEKQQAFLNATIEQGKKKFDLIAESVAANPYDKLAASFADLSKILLQLVGNVLEPLVSLLAKSPVALFGVLTMFGSTIIKSILPAVSDLAAKQKEIASQAAVMAKKASTVISTKYKEAQATIKKLDFSISPKYVQSLEKQFKSGKISAEELKKSITTLKISETQRNKQNIKYSGEALINYKAETAAIVEQRLAMEGLAAADKQKYTKGAASAEARKGSNVKGITARGFSEMEKTTGVLDKLAVAYKYAGLQMQGLTDRHNKGVKGLARLKVGFKAAAGAAMLMGSALLNMIPIIGQILFVISLLWPYLEEFFGKGAVAKAADEVSKSMENTSKITAQLTVKLGDLESAEEKYMATLKVRSGLMEQIRSGMAKIEETAEIERATKLIELKTRQQKAEQDVLNMQKKGIFSIEQIALMQKVATDASAAYTAMEEEKVTVSNEIIKGMLREQVIRMKVGEGAIYYAEEILLLENEIKGLKDGESQTKKQLEGLDDRLERTTHIFQETKGVIGAYAELGRLSRKNAAKARAEGKEEIDALDAIIKGTERLGKLGAGDKKLAVNEADIKALDNMGKALGVSDSFSGSLKEKAVETKRLYEEHLDVLAEQPAITKVHLALASELGQVSKNNAALKQAELDASLSALESEKKRLESAYAIKLAKAGNDENAQSVKKAAAELLVIEQKIAATDDDGFKVGIARLNQEKQMLGFTDKMLASQQKLNSIKTASARRSLELLKAQQGLSISAADELQLLRDRKKLENEKNEEGKTLKEQKETAALDRIRIEFDLLNLQFALEKSKIERLLEEDKLSGKTAETALATIDKLRGGVSGAKAKAVEVKKAEFADKDAEDANKEALLGLKIAKEARKLELDQIDLKIQNAERLGDRQRVLDLRDEQHKKIITQLEKERGELVEGSATYEYDLALKTLEIEKQRLAKRKEDRAAQIATIDKFASATGSATVAQGAKNSLARADRAANIASLDAEASKDGLSDEDRAAKVRAVDAAKKSNMIATREEASLSMNALAEDLRAIGPEGELMALTLDGIASLNTAFTLLGEDGGSALDKVQAGLAVVGAILTMGSQIQKQASAEKIKAIDSEIAAEKNRDGKSAASVAKLKSLEKKKDAAARKSFETQKKMKMAQTVVATATGAIEAYATGMSIGGAAGPVVGAMLAGLVIAMGAKSLATIASTSYQGGGSSGAGGAGAGAATSISMGNRKSSADMAKSQSAAGELADFRGQDGTGGAENFKPAFSGAKYRGAGGNVGFVVGERGPELFVPETPGRVVANDDIGEGNVQAITFNINTVDATGVEELLVEQRGNIIGMLRDASNSYGEPFMEKVDTSSMTPTQGAGLFGGGIERAYGSNTFKRR